MAIFSGHFYGAAMKSVSATEFKSRCLAMIDEVHRTRHPLQITRHGKPVAEIVPPSAATSRGSNPLRGSVLFQDDLIAPIAVDWDSAP
jgi:prevent-host-death family protein